MRGRRIAAAGITLAVLVSGCARASSVAGPAGAGTGSPTSSSGHGISVVTKIHVGGQPCGVVFAAGTVWISDADSGRLLRIDPAFGDVRQTDRLDPTPCEIASGFGAIWVVTQSGQLDRVDPATNRVTRIVHLAGAPGGIAYAAGALWVGDDTSGSHRFFRVDPKSGEVTRVAAGNRPGYVAVTPGRVWVSGVDDSTVTEIDARNAKRLRTVHVGISPVNLAGRATDVWVPEDIGNEVVRIDARTGRVVGRIAAPDAGPAVVAPGDGDIWVTMFDSGEVWRLRPST